MHVADAVGILAGCEVVHALVRKPADMRIQHPDINELALAGFRLMAHRGEDADRRVHTGHQVADRHRHFHRFAIRHAGEAHHAAHRLDQPVVSRPRGVGAGLAKAGDGPIDQAWKLRFQLIVTKAVALQGSGLEVLDQNIAVRHEFLRESLAFRRAEVDGDRALVAVSAGVIGALARLLALVIALIGWREAARIVPAARALHLDHFRAEIAEDLRAMRSGQDAREIEYLNSVERTPSSSVTFVDCRGAASMFVRRRQMANRLEPSFPNGRCCRDGRTPSFSIAGVPASQLRFAGCVGFLLQLDGSFGQQSSKAACDVSRMRRLRRMATGGRSPISEATSIARDETFP